ncbi:MAG: phosphotransferase [Chloroflexi bacterium]|nr:phosphotransferase [Chloroflexota bacterium]
MTRAAPPPYVTARPPDAALDWAARAAGGGARVVGVRSLTRSRWHANHVLRLQPVGGMPYELVLRRWARPGWDLEDEDFNARREALVLELLAPTDAPAPRLVAVDAYGSHADVPALLMTKLDGRPPDRGSGGARVASQLAAALAGIHGVGAPPNAAPAYRPWHDPRSARPLPWMGHDPAWSALYELAASPGPDVATGFIHRDYHHGNTLWEGDRLTGIVDWTTGSWGPYGVDVGHARLNLALAYSQRAADLFVAEYERLSSREYVHTAYWDAVQLVDMLGDVEGAPPPARRKRLERYVKDLLKRS